MSELGGKIHTNAGPVVAINCLWCGRQSVRAQSRLQTEWLTLFHLFPLLRMRNVFVRCSGCGKDMIAKCSFAEVATSVTLQPHLAKPQSLVGRVCIVVGLLLCWAPGIGVIPAAIGFLFRKQFGSAMRTMSWIGLGLSLVITGLGMLLTYV